MSPCSSFSLSGQEYRVSCSCPLRIWNCSVSELELVVDVRIYLHNAVCIGMVMDCAALSGAPNKNKLIIPC